MPKVTVAMPGQAGLKAGASDVLQSSGYTQALNIYYQPELGNWMPRPTWIYSSFKPSNDTHTVARAGGGSALFLMGDSNPLITHLAVNRMAPSPGTGNATLSTALSISANANQFSHATAVGVNSAIMFNDQGTLRLAYLNVNPLVGTQTVVYSATPMLRTSTPLNAFGRLWYGFRNLVAGADGTSAIGWTDAAYTGLTGAGTGFITLPETVNDAKSLHELSRRLVAVGSRSLYLYSGANGAAPLDPNSAGGIVLADSLDGVGTEVGDWAIKAEDSIFVLGSSGLHRITAEAFNNQPEASLVGGDALQYTAKRWYAENYQSAVTPVATSSGVTPVYQASGVYWPHGRCVIFSAPNNNTSLVVSLKATGETPISIWTGATPVSYQAANNGLYGVWDSNSLGLSTEFEDFDVAIGLLRYPGEPKSFTGPALYLGFPYAEAPYTVTGIISGPVASDLVGFTFPRTMAISAAMYRFMTPNERTLYGGSDSWRLVQDLEGTIIPVSGERIIADDGIAPLPASSTISPYTTKSYVGNLQGGSSHVRIGYTIDDGRFLQFAANGITLTYNQGRSWAQ